MAVASTNLDNFFAEVDTNNDGAISFEEWRYVQQQTCEDCAQLSGRIMDAQRFEFAECLEGARSATQSSGPPTVANRGCVLVTRSTIMGTALTSTGTFFYLYRSAHQTSMPSCHISLLR